MHRGASDFVRQLEMDPIIGNVLDRADIGLIGSDRWFDQKGKFTDPIFDVATTVKSLL